MGMDGVFGNRIDAVKNEGFKEVSHGLSGCPSDVGEPATTKSMLENLKNSCVGRVLSSMGAYLSKVTGGGIETEVESLRDSTESVDDSIQLSTKTLGTLLGISVAENKSENFLIARVRDFFTKASVALSGLMVFASDESNTGSVDRKSGDVVFGTFKDDWIATLSGEEFSKIQGVNVKKPINGAIEV